MSSARAIASASYGATGVSAWDPTKLAGLFEWHRADLGFTGATWADQSGAGNDAAQATPARRPVLTPNVANGKPGLTGTNAALTLMTLPSFAGIGASDTFMVLKNTFNTGHIATLNYAPYYFSQVSSGDWYPYADDTIYLSGTSSLRPGFAVPLGLDLTQVHILEVATSATQFVVRINGTVLYNSPGSYSPAGGSSPTLFGTFASSFEGTILESFACNRIVTAGERTEAEAYLTGRYAL